MLVDRRYAKQISVADFIQVFYEERVENSDIYFNELVSVYGTMN